MKRMARYCIRYKEYTYLLVMSPLRSELKSITMLVEDGYVGPVEGSFLATTIRDFMATNNRQELYTYNINAGNVSHTTTNIQWEPPNDDQQRRR